MYTWQEMLWDTAGTEEEVVETLFNETIFPDLKVLEDNLKQAGFEVSPVLKKYTLDDRMLTRLNWKQGGEEYQVCLQHQHELSLLLETNLAAKQMGGQQMTGKPSEDKQAPHESYCSLQQLSPKDSGESFLDSWRDELSRIYQQHRVSDSNKGTAGQGLQDDDDKIVIAPMT